MTRNHPGFYTWQPHLLRKRLLWLTQAICMPIIRVSVKLYWISVLIGLSPRTVLYRASSQEAYLIFLPDI